MSSLLEFSQPRKGLNFTLLDMNQKNNKLESPLILAQAKGFYNLADQLIQSGANVNMTVQYSIVYYCTDTVHE